MTSLTNLDTVFDIEQGRQPPSPSPPSTTKQLLHADHRRRAWCRRRALGLVSLDAHPSKSFDLSLARVRRRWPVSAAGSEFEEEARRVWKKEVDEFERWRKEEPAEFARCRAETRRVVGRGLDIQKGNQE